MALEPLANAHICPYITPMEATEQRPLRHLPRPLYALLGVMGLGVALRVFRLGQWSLWYDECASIYYTRYVGLNCALFDDSQHTEPPLFAIVLFFWETLFDAAFQFSKTSLASDFAYRLLPAIFSVLIMPPLYLLARRLTRSDAAAIWAVVFFAVSPFHIYYAQELRSYSLLTLFGVLALYCVLRALEDDRPRYWVGLVICLTAMMYTHYITVWYIFACGVFFLLALPWYRHHFWKWTAWFSVLMALIAPALVLAYRANAHVLTIKHHRYDTPTLKTGFITLKNFLAGYTPNVAIYWPLFLLGILLALWGLYWLARKRPAAAIFVVVLVVVPIFGNVVLWAYRDFSYYQHRLFILSGMLLLIPMGLGLVQLPGRAAKMAVVGLFGILSTVGLVDYYRQHLHPMDHHRLGTFRKVDFRSAAHFLNHQNRDDGIVVCASFFMVYGFHHYLESPHHYVGMPPNPAQTAIDNMGNPVLLANHGLLADSVDSVLATAESIWFVASHGLTFEYKPSTEQIRDWIEARMTRVEEHRFDGMSVTLYKRKAFVDGEGP